MKVYPIHHNTETPVSCKPLDLDSPPLQPHCCVSQGADPETLLWVDAISNGDGGIQGMGAPRALGVSPDSLHIYVGGSDGGGLAVFQRAVDGASVEFRRSYLDIDGESISPRGSSSPPMEGTCTWWTASAGLHSFREILRRAASDSSAGQFRRKTDSSTSVPSLSAPTSDPLYRQR